MITKKLLEFQKLGISVKKDGKNPHFKSNYATLNEVLEKVKKPLNDMGVVIIQLVGISGLTTKLIDTEDESEAECIVPFINPTDMQKLGSAITYARRYSLVSMLGLEDEDDDGEKASDPTVQYAPKSAPKATVAPKIDPFKGAEDAIHKAMTPEELSKLGERVQSSKLLTEEQKADLMDTLAARAELV